MLIINIKDDGVKYLNLRISHKNKERLLNPPNTIWFGVIKKL